MLYKDNSSGQNINYPFKEGRQRSLYSNKTNDCRPSLSSKIHFSKEAVDNFIRLAKILKRIHIRMVMEGWKIENGKFINPEGKEFHYEDTPTKNK